MRQVLVAAVLLAAALAGCASAADTVPARAGLQAAYDAARAYGADPVLVAVKGVEPFHASGRQEDARTESDMEPDGRAPAWTYTFRAGDDIIDVRYAARAGATVEVADAGHPGLPLQVDRWLFDAPEVARLLSGMAGWPPAGEATGVEWHLFQNGPGPTWAVQWEDASGTSRFWVDAATGNFTQPAIGLGQVFCASIHSPGGPVTSTTEVSLSLGVGDNGSLEYAYQWRVAVDQVLAQVEGPTGVVHDVRLRGSGSQQDEVSGLDAGTYTLRFSAAQGAGTVSGLALTTCT